MTSARAADQFEDRHIGPSEADQRDMLREIGVPSLDALIDQTVPQGILDTSGLDLPALSEAEALTKLQAMARQNIVARSFIGMGYHDCLTPPVIQRNVLENPGWYTAYTPYQAEISQGRMEALINFQQAIIDLTGMEIANASLLDEGTAAAEAMTFMNRVGKSKADALFVDAACHPQTIEVIQTRAAPLGIPVIIGDPATDLDASAVFGAVLTQIATTGEVRDLSTAIAALHEIKALACVVTDPLSLVLLEGPGAMDADVVIGTAQRFGVPLGFGGPHAAYFATRQSFMRSIPGRIIGVSKDAQDHQAYRMALQTREQHIRREKATSNICTAQVLLANMAGFYAVYHGAEGLDAIARRIHGLTVLLAKGLRQMGFDAPETGFFDTITVNLGDSGAAAAVHDRAKEAGINFRPFEDGRIGISLNEATSPDDVGEIWDIFKGESSGLDLPDMQASEGLAIPDALQRKSPILTHPVFSAYRSETAMMRYLKRLEDKDLALNRAMIPLGSCTMKLNAAAEMMPVTWAEFARIHPFAPADQTAGYRAMIQELETWLEDITGFDAVSLQPNAGSQGEYAGLLTIRAYHRAQGNGERTVCLIPSSAHGTNPASAVMAGMKVVVVACDDDGNVDLSDLKAKAEAHKDDLAALMVTYPSTHGVFEEHIRDICDVVHKAGGQVYMDGANLQAMVGLCRPGTFGPDVAHMNLHKTFCIPHGGGGPGVGPIGVAAHLAPHLPGHGLNADVGGPDAITAVSAAPWGSAGILPISWCYIAMMGHAGLRKATEVAILSANYLASRLAGHFDCLFKGKGGFVAHECIIDTRILKDKFGISVDDVAKRLIDFGFHSPTMSWPVAGTLMIEPTESEPKAELDRFADAMIQIAEEAGKIGDGTWPLDDNPLVNAPHTAEMVTADSWDHPYSRSEAAYPLPHLRQEKYWAPVARVDNVFGDRNVVCTCPPLEAYQDAAE